MNYNTIIDKLFIGVVAVLFASCSDDSTVENITQVMQSNMDVVNKVKDLPKCTKETTVKWCGSKASMLLENAPIASGTPSPKGAWPQLAPPRNSRIKAA